MAGRISSLLQPARIALQLRGTDRPAVLEELAQLVAGHPDITDFAGFHAALLARDQLDTTCLGNGIALPHARTSHVKRIVLAVGRRDQGLPFDASGEIVRLWFMLCTPKSQPGDYLAVVSTLCKLLRAPADRAALLDAPTPEAFLAALVAIETRLGL